MSDRPLVFLGTPGAAAEVLEALVARGETVVRVVTGADKRRGRGSAVSPSPVKVVAQQHGIPVDHDLSWFEGDLPAGVLGIVVAFGRIIPGEILRRMPMWNLHFSLLPRWRGAAPVARAILAGDSETGVCVMEMDEGLDTGAVIGRIPTSIEPRDTTDSLTSRLVSLGIGLLGSALDSHDVVPEPQTGAPTYASKIDPIEGRIDWTWDANRVDRTVRSLRAYGLISGERVRIVAAEPAAADPDRRLSAGELRVDGLVGTGDGVIRLLRVQRSGKPVQDAAEWLRGWRGPWRFDESGD